MSADRIVANVKQGRAFFQIIFQKTLSRSLDQTAAAINPIQAGHFLSFCKIENPR